MHTHHSGSPRNLFLEPKVFVSSQSNPEMTAFLCGPYPNGEPEPSSGKASVHELSNELKQVTGTWSVFISPGGPWGPACVISSPTSAHAKRQKPVFDVGLGPKVCAANQERYSSHSLPPGQRSWLLPYIPITEGCLNWEVPQICRFGLVNGKFPKKVSHFYFEALHTLTLLLKGKEKKEGRGGSRNGLRWLIWQLKIHKWKNCCELAQRAIINNVLHN